MSKDILEYITKTRFRSEEGDDGITRYQEIIDEKETKDEYIYTVSQDKYIFQYTVSENGVYLTIKRQDDIGVQKKYSLPEILKHIITLSRYLPNLEKDIYPLVVNYLKNRGDENEKNIFNFINNATSIQVVNDDDTLITCSIKSSLNDQEYQGFFTFVEDIEYYKFRILFNGVENDKLVHYYTYVDNDKKDWKIFLRYHPLLQELFKYSYILEI